MLHIDDELLHIAGVRSEYFEFPVHAREQDNSRKSKSTKSNGKAGRQKKKKSQPHFTKWSRMNMESPVEDSPTKRPRTMKEREEIYEPLEEFIHNNHFLF